MATEEDKQGEETEAENAAPKKSKKGLFLGGGIVGLVATGYILSMMAIPSVEEARAFDGPFVVPLATDQVQVNLSGEGGKRFLVMSLKAEYVAYDEPYAMSRVTDVLYNAKLQDALIAVARQKSKSDLDDTVGQDVFKGEIRDAVNPLLFPVHVGNEASAVLPHEESGLAPGDSNDDATMRGGFFSHTLTVDGERKTIQLDDGPELVFEGNETDLVVQGPDGSWISVDVTGVDEEFAGTVHVGVFGLVRGIYFDKFLVQ